MQFISKHGGEILLSNIVWLYENWKEMTLPLRTFLGFTRAFVLALLLFLPACEKETSPYFDPENDIRHLRIYQVMVESFMDGDPERGYGEGYGLSHHQGDLRGIINALPYIKSLGVNAIWMTPIFDSGKGEGKNIGWEATGYFPKDYFRIDPAFGTLEDARELVDTAHELGLYVFLDGVFGHHKETVMPSPQGRTPVGNPRQVDYPASLPFYKEVATYWIDELNIDGWRLDQAYQVPVSAWQEIREAIEEKCRERKAAGKEWGTLGYLVGEIWKGEREISEKGYGKNLQGLPSCFDFPLRYRLVQTLAVEENGFGHRPASALREGLHSRSKYPKGAQPNLMLTNHDLVRFGDLIERAGYPGKGDPTYWLRHRSALSFLAATSGPITIYYGDEYGEEVPGFVHKELDRCWEKGLCDDHVSRTSGRIDGFTPEETALQDYLRSLLDLRDRHAALWKGERDNLIASETIFADYKIWEDDRMIYVLNTGLTAETVKFDAERINGSKLRDALDDETFEVSEANFSVTVPGLSARFLIVE